MPNIGFWATAGAGAASVPAYELISTTILSAFSTSVTLSSIPSGYKHLQVRTTLYNGNSNGLVRMTVNGDNTAANYRSHRMYGNSSSVQSTTYTGNPWMYITDLSANASTFAPGIIDILDYGSTAKNKTVRGFSGFFNASDVSLYSGLWMSTAAVTSLTFTDNGGYRFDAGSRFSLYGIKG